MKKAAIYGYGNTGKIAYMYLKDKYEIVFFVDKNADELGHMRMQGIDVPVFVPDELLKWKDIKIIIASIWYREILADIKRLGIMNQDIELFRIGMKSILPDEIEEALDTRTINLGDFLIRQSGMSCKELTFVQGGSYVLDYIFLKQIAINYRCKEYLEVGTYIGESINILTECCEKLYSITVPKSSPYSMKNWCKEAKLPDYSERLTYSKKIVHYYMDSKEFDFSKHADTIELYFIDGDHSYKGVYYDTKNIFDHKREDAIVIWHDFKEDVNQYNPEVVKAVKDALGSEFDNVYVTDNNLCGIYVPRCRKFEFKMHRRCYEENVPLYTYDIILNNCKVYKE